VRVGRSALDEDAIRLIEQHNPDVEFDWTRILKGQDAPPEPKPISQQDRRTRPRPREFPPAAPGPSARVAAEPSPVVVAEPGPVGHSGSDLEPPGFAPGSAALEIDIEQLTGDSGLGLSDLTRVPSGLEPAADPQRLDLPTPEADPEFSRESFSSAGSPGIVSPPQDRSLEPLTAAQTRLGFEGLSRLRARHAEVLARISEKVTDDARREQLKSDAERLNPDTWVTDTEVTAGLESYETVFESLRGVVGRRRKKRGRPAGGSGAAAPAPSPGTETDGEASSNEPGEDV
jgi:hypothetical protein